MRELIRIAETPTDFAATVRQMFEESASMRNPTRIRGTN